MMKLKNKKKNKIKANPRAFTLIEILVSIFIFVLIISGSSVMFTKIFSYYRKATHYQQDLENAQYAMNLLSKVFRTSSVVDVAGDEKSITVFNYSQMQCAKYVFENDSLAKYTSAANGVSACAAIPFSFDGRMTSGIVNGHFRVEKSGEKGTTEANVGKITLVMNIGAGGKTISIQTTTSLRDYGVSGININ